MNIPYYYFDKRNLPIHVYTQLKNYSYMADLSLQKLGFTESMRIIRREIKTAKKSKAPFMSVDRVAKIIIETVYKEAPEWQEELLTVN